MDDIAPSVTRRHLLTGLGVAGAGSLAGCSERLWTAAERSPHEQVSVTIKALPAEYDVMAATIASHLEANLDAAGIDAGFEPIEESELYRQTLINADFDVFVVRYPGYDDPDELRALLHSDFMNEQGWQNPFRFSDSEVDELLETQCGATGDERTDVFADLFERLGEIAPFTTVAFPDRLGASNGSLDPPRPPQSPLDYYEVLANRWNQRTDDEVDDDDSDSDDENGDDENGNDENGDDSGGESTLRIGLVEQTIGDRLNPIAVDVRDISALLGLLYDPLVRHDSATDTPWLAESVEWDDGSNGRSLEATATLREGTTWHDGESLDARDVAFTVRFLQDTSLGEAESAVPAPRYRGRSTLIDDVTALDDRRVRFSFDGCTEDVARRALTLPVLPEHVWEQQTGIIDTQVTEALRWDNEEPIGSGLYAFADSSTREYVELEPYDDHVLHDVDVENYDGLFDEVDLTERIEFRVSPNIGSALDGLTEGDIDFIGSHLTPNELENIDDAEEATVLRAQTHSFYFVGYNLRHPEFSLPQFRQAVSRLIDREYVVEEFFDGYAVAPTTIDSLLGLAPGAWDGPGLHAGTKLDFPGSEGEVDEERAQSLFEAAGYRYEDGELIV